MECTVSTLYSKYNTGTQTLNIRCRSSISIFPATLGGFIFVLVSYHFIHHLQQHAVGVWVSPCVLPCLKYFVFFFFKTAFQWDVFSCCTDLNAAWDAFPPCLKISEAEQFGFDHG